MKCGRRGHLIAIHWRFGASMGMLLVTAKLIEVWLSSWCQKSWCPWPRWWLKWPWDESSMPMSRRPLQRSCYRGWQGWCSLALQRALTSIDDGMGGIDVDHGMLISWPLMAFAKVIGDIGALNSMLKAAPRWGAWSSSLRVFHIKTYLFI